MKRKNSRSGRTIYLLIALVCVLIPVGVIARATWAGSRPMPDYPRDRFLPATQGVIELDETTEAALIATKAAQEIRQTAYFAGVNATWTAEAIRISETPTPALTDSEREALYRRWKTDVENSVGFSHPVLDDLVADTIRADAPSIMDAGWLDTYRIPLAITRTTYNQAEYVAIVTSVPGGRSSGSSQLLLFRILQGQPEYIRNNIQTRPIGNMLYLTGEFEAFPNGFADRNGNGAPDLPIFTTTLGSSPLEIMVLLEIQPDGSVKDITPNPITARPLSMVDINHDGILEIRGVHKFTDVPLALPNCCFPHIVSFYGWNGPAYVDISATVDEATYYPDIIAFWQSIASVDGCLLPDEAMYKALVAYLGRGTLADGWSMLQPRLQWEKCSPETRTANEYGMGRLLAWIARYRPNAM